MDFDGFLERAWQDHAEHAAAVAVRLPGGIPLVAEEAQLLRLMNLAHHLHGEHLGDWRAGLDMLDRLAALPTYVAEGPSGQAWRRSVASLRLSQGSATALDSLSVSDRVRVSAMAACNLVRFDSARAKHLLDGALAQADGLPRDDPMNRALAVAGNNLAATLEELPERSAAQCELMLLAARTTRRYWEIAGTWLETERAEYRLSRAFLLAGDPGQARLHAQACLDIVSANQGEALERFFGWEALGLATRAEGDATTHSQAVTHARKAFDELDESDKSWCAESLEKLAA